MCCMPNVKNVIDGHNKKIRDESKKNKEQESQEKTCNCRKPADCPLNGQCLTKSVIYQATVTTEDDGSKETYIGLTKNVFKERFNGPQDDFPTFKQAQQHRTKQIRLEIKRARKTIQHQYSIRAPFVIALYYLHWVT